MKRIRGVACILAAGWAIVSSSPAVALNTSTHRIINVQAAEQSSLDAVLREELGHVKGLDEVFKGRKATAWLGEGGVREDDIEGLTFRFLRHFHDPLQPWGSAGLLFGVRWDSSIRWMQRPDQGWSWLGARLFYLAALTAETPAEREQAFADTFRALGQVMHLIVDASVPEHVRNDLHPKESICRFFGIRCYGNYEYWVSDRQGRPGSPAEEAFIAEFLSPAAITNKKVTLAETILQQPTGDPGAPAPVARLIDTKTYKDTTPTDPTVTLGPAIGIAEVANANFFSEDTGNVRLLGPNYPFPDRTRLVRTEHVSLRTGRPRAYYAKGAGDGLPVDPALAECALDEPASVDGVLEPRSYNCVDENVWQATATEMLPRAVVYARAALDHFFRGRLEVTFTADSTDPTRSLLNVTNWSTEPLGPGTVTVYANDASGTRQPVAGATLTVTAAVARGEPLPPIPVAASLQSSPFVVVYTGTLGGEAEAVVGLVHRPPTVVEQVFRGPADWMLRTMEGVFPLGLGFGPHEVKWGERDNTLLTQTFLAGGDMAVAAYQINRPEGSSAVPLTPEGVVDLVPIGSASLSGPAIDLQTTFSIQRTERTNQQLVLVNRVFQSNTSPAQVQYSLAEVLTRNLGDFPFSRSVPLAMRLPDTGNDVYGWFVPRVFLNRDGEILGVVQVSPFSIIDENNNQIPCWRHVDADNTGATLALILIGARPGCGFFVQHDYPVSLGAMPFVVNLTRRSLVAKSTADAVAITYSTDRDLWSVDVRNFSLDGTVSCCQWVDGFHIGANAGGPVAGEFTIRDHIVELTMAGLHRQEFVSVGFANRALVDAPSTAVVPIIPANIAVTPGLSLRVTTARRYSCPDTTSIEELDAAKGASGEYLAIGKTLCGFDAPARFTPVRWSPASGSATRFASFELPPNSFVMLAGASADAAMALAFGSSGMSTFLATPTQVFVFPGDLSSEYRLLESGGLLNVQTFQLHSLDATLTPMRALPPLAAGGPLEGEYHLVGTP